MKRTIKTLILTGVVAWVLSIPARAQVVLPPGVDNALRSSAGETVKVDPSTIHAPWDVAPPEQIVAGRDPMSFRKEGTLLARATREIPQVAEGNLLERKYAMYSGRRFHRSPHGAPEAEEARRAVVARVLPAQAGPDAGGDVFGWIAWSLVGVTVVVLLVGWRRGWFASSSVRSVRATHVYRAASPQVRSRAAKKPLFELVSHKK